MERIETFHLVAEQKQRRATEQQEPPDKVHRDMLQLIYGLELSTHGVLIDMYINIYNKYVTTFQSIHQLEHILVHFVK